MARKSSTEVRIKCLKCNDYTQSIPPVMIKKYDNNKYQLTTVCYCCNNSKTKKANMSQIALLPDEIKNAPNGKLFVNDIEKDGGILPILPLILAIAAGVTAVSTAAGTVASNVIQKQKNDAEIEIQKSLAGKGILSEEEQLHKYVNKLEGMGFRVYRL